LAEIFAERFAEGLAGANRQHPILPETDPFPTEEPQIIPIR
jgi:hypothetical protein